MTNPEAHQNNPAAVAEQGNDHGEAYRDKWMENIEPLLDHMDVETLEKLSNLNAEIDDAYNTAAAEAINNGVAWLESTGLSHEDALAQITAETETRGYERRMMRSLLEDYEQNIDDLLTHFTFDIDPDDPLREQKIDDMRQAIETVASMPREEWYGEEDEDGNRLANGVFDDVAREFIPDYDQLLSGESNEDPDDPDDNPNPAPGPAPTSGSVYTSQNAIGRAVVPTNPEVAARYAQNGRAPEQRNPAFDRREHLRNVQERYGAKIGDQFVFTQQLPDGNHVYIHYRVVGFPARLPGEPMDPVTLQRTEQYFDPQNRPLTPPRWNVYNFSGSHVANLGKDIKTFNKKHEAMDLNQYWADFRESKEGKKRWKKGMKIAVGAAAAFGAGFLAHKYGHDITQAVSHMRDLFHIGGGQGMPDGGNLDNGMIGGMDGIPNPTDVVPDHNVLPDPSQMTPDQVEMFKYLTAPVHDNMGGLELYHNLGLDPQTWLAQSHDLVAKFPNDFFTFDAGTHAGEVGLRHPGQPLSPQAALYIAQTNHLV